MKHILWIFEYFRPFYMHASEGSWCIRKLDFEGTLIHSELLFENQHPWHSWLDALDWACDNLDWDGTPKGGV